MKTRKNPRGHACHLIRILASEPHWQTTMKELETLENMVNRFDKIMEAEEQEAESKAYADFHERAYGIDLYFIR